MKQKRQFPGATPYTDRHGRRRWRFRRGNFSAELGTDYGSEEFLDRYEAALSGQRSVGGAGQCRTRPGSLSAVVASYYRSPAFLDLAASTQRVYKGIIEPFREAHGDKLIAQLRRRHVSSIIAEKADTPAAANNLLKRIRQVCDHAISMELRDDNPALHVKPYSVVGDGFHTWDEGEIVRFFGLHRTGTLAHRAVTLMLFTGAARSDVVQLGWQNVRGDRIEYRRRKTLRTGGALISIPMHRDLAAVIAACSRDSLTFLETERGAARSPNGLGNLMRKWCREANLPECSAHGLRKACARRLAEAGATAHEIASITGHKTLSEVQRYTEKVNRADMADSAIAKLSARPNEEQNLTNHPTRFAKRLLKGKEK